MKRTYFRLEDDITIPKRWHLGVASLNDGTEPRLRVGLRLETNETLSVPVTHPGRVLDFTLTSFAVPVMTKTLALSVNLTANEDVQLLPVTIAGHSGMFVFNVLRVVRCVDEAHSEFIKWTEHDHRADLAGQYRQITKLVLNRNAIPSNAEVFRIEGSFVELMVSEAVKEAMERTGCLGAAFTEIPLSD